MEKTKIISWNVNGIRAIIKEDFLKDIEEIENGDDITVDLNNNELNCKQLTNEAVYEHRKLQWDRLVDGNKGIHPFAGEANTRLLNSMRRSAVSAVYGAGMHPDRTVWVKDPREAKRSNFQPHNKFK